MLKKCFLIFLSGIIFLISCFSPAVVSADEVVQDAFETTPQFFGFNILGYDAYGNVMLSPDDYDEYLNNCLAWRAEEMKQNPDLPAIDYSLGANPEIMPLLSFEDVQNFTRFMPWTWGIVHFAEIVRDFLTPSDEDLSDDSVVYKPSVSAVGKRRIYYEKSNIYELAVLQFEGNPGGGLQKATLSRSGFGAGTTYTLNYNAKSSYNLTWTDTGFYINSRGVLSESVMDFGFTASSTNSLRTLTVASSTALSSTSYAFWGDSYNRAWYTENSYFSNDFTYQANHTLVQSRDQYFTGCQFNYPINSGTTVNLNNYGDFAVYGYYVNPEGHLSFDPDILDDYINNILLPQWEQEYKQFYSQFPDIDATYGETEEGETFFNPFEDDTLPPATYPPGGGGMTPAELESVLSKGNYDILDLETGLPEMTLGTLPDVDNLPASLKDASSGVFTFALDFFKATGILPIFMFLTVFAFIVFALKG